MRTTTWRRAATGSILPLLLAACGWGPVGAFIDDYSVRYCDYLSTFMSWAFPYYFDSVEECVETVAAELEGAELNECGFDADAADACLAVFDASTATCDATEYLYAYAYYYYYSSYDTPEIVGIDASVCAAVFDCGGGGTGTGTSTSGGGSVPYLSTTNNPVYGGVSTFGY